MKLAVMQPYLFPYVGYYQLVAAVDRFVFLDDVSYIKNGWINRNKLVLSGEIRYFTVPVASGSTNRRIVDIEVANDTRWRRKLFSSISQSYGSAPLYEPTVALIHEVLDPGETSMAVIARHSIVAIARYLGLKVEFVSSAGRYPEIVSRGAVRVLDICTLEGASEYYNLPGGSSLYRAEDFRLAGMRLEFVEPNLHPYPRAGQPFTPGLSMLDVLMFNDPASAASLLLGKQRT